MTYQDTVYGAVEIDEPVLVDLMESAALQRLKGVLQHGISGWLGITSPVTRYEHSVGTMLLARRLGAGLPEQIAALLHDVSHTVFSHVIDYAMELDVGASYHEMKKEAFIAASDLPALLARYGHDWHDFLDDGAYPILEQPAPALCADRLDYFFRDGIGLDRVEKTDIERVLKSLTIHQGRLVVKHRRTGAWLARTYMAIDQASWAHIREVGLYYLMAQAIRDARDGGVITEDDFWTTDAVFWKKLHQADETLFRKPLDLISTKTRFYYNDRAADFHVPVKLRTIDPDILIDGETQVLSTLDREYAGLRDMYLSLAEDPWPLRVEEG